MASNDDEGGDNVVQLDAKRPTKKGAKNDEKKGGRLAVPPIVPVADIKLSERSRPGRKPKLNEDDDTLERIRQLAILQLTQDEAACVMLVAPSTFKAFLKSSELAREAWDMGPGAGKASVKRAQFVMAHRSAVMSIWWGKQHLGQTDKVEAEVQHEHDIVGAAAGDFDRLLARLAERVRATGSPERTH